jgi:hypothetical protein
MLVGPTDVTKTPDLLDYYTFKGLSNNDLDIQPNVETASDYTPMIVTISTHIITRQKSTKLHNCKIDWEGFRNQNEEKLRLNIPPAQNSERNGKGYYINHKVIEKAA